MVAWPFRPSPPGCSCRCPNCGEGKVFRGFLKFKERCDACGADLTIADVGDGASFFVMWVALILVVPTAMIFELWSSAAGSGFTSCCGRRSSWCVCMFLLRPFKATLFALQWKHKAGEAKFEE